MDERYPTGENMNDASDVAVEPPQKESPVWMTWDWQWNDENLWIHAIDPADEDSRHIVFEFASDPGPELLNMIMDSREVILNIEKLINDKIETKRNVVSNVDIVMKSYDELHAAVIKGTQKWVGQKLTRKKWGRMLDSLFEELNKVLTVNAEVEETTEH